MLMQRLKSRIPHTFFQFALIGVGGLLVDIAVLYSGLWWLGLSWLWAKLLSFLVAATFTWWMNRIYTFGKSNKPLLLEWASFLATNAFGGLVNISVYSAIVTQFYPYPWLPAIATCFGSVSGLFFNYLSSRHFVFNQTNKLETIAKDSIVMETPPFPSILYWATALLCLIFGLVSAYLGMDASLDLKNQYWQNGWVYLNGTMGRDWLVSNVASFDNPIIIASYTWIAKLLPAHAVGFSLGILHGLNFLPLAAIAWQLSTLSNLRHRLYSSAILALVGVGGAGALTGIGLSFCGNSLSLGIYASIYLCLAHWEKIHQNQSFTHYLLIAIFGIPLGIVIGLKQSLIIFGVGLITAFLITHLPLLRRLSTSFSFGIGVLIGFGISGGYWAYYLWKSLNNPIFPYFNNLFESPRALPISYLDPNLSLHSLMHRLLESSGFCQQINLCPNVEFRDFRIISMIILAGVASMLNFWRKQAHPFSHYAPTLWLLASSIFTYLCWLAISSSYSILVPLEMLAPLLSVAAIGLMPFSKRIRLGFAILLLVLLSVTTKVGDWGRMPRQGQTLTNFDKTSCKKFSSAINVEDYEACQTNLSARFPQIS